MKNIFYIGKECLICGGTERYKKNNICRSCANTRWAKSIIEGDKIINEYKSRPCQDCGGSFPPYCMDFDHIRGNKINDIANMRNRSREILIAEIEKCEIVCANCHRIRTYGKGG